MSDLIEKLKKIEPAQDQDKFDIAIIDDDFSFCVLLKDYLYSNAELEACVFSSGENFLQEYKSKDNRIIILDYDFGKGLNGLSVLQKIKSINPNARVIMVSSLDDLEAALEIIRNGAVDYFLKTNKTVFANIHCSLMKILEMERNRWN
jgi:DNA-binding NtrC family response regulator